VEESYLPKQRASSSLVGILGFHTRFHYSFLREVNVLRKAGLFIVIAILLFSLSTSVYSNQDFDYSDRPITKALCEDTAYTLTRGEWKVGALSIPFYPSQWQYTYVQYGLGDNLQVGSTIPQNVLGRPNISAKYRLPFNGPANSTLAVPVSLNLNLSYLGVSTNTGLVASWKPNERTGFHVGLNLWLTSYSYRFFNPSGYLVADYNFLSNLKAIGEVDLHTFGEDFLSIRAGGLWRVLDFLNLKLSSSVDLPSGDMSAWASLFLRF